MTAAGPPPELGEVEAFFRRNGLPHLADSPDFREATLRRLRPLVFGLLIVDRALTAEWVGERPNVLVDVSISGREVIVSEALVRVAAILGGFAALYFVAVALGDRRNREQFLDDELDRMGRVMAAWSYYRGALAARVRAPRAPGAPA